ncbi:hypothetical protein [Phaeodactylibacter luteus]|uniref:Uncharacterized protein n=1 Tax=Phaeodactylibacter luteus TaxID=1564516 RepID=A0A5C6RHL0_9BACT|nr:hypothetical protein [Phaeodactylibacter luteus]TXB61583.1 hypothetical protein FRY97_18495 [Phaeodactylibacter luteus]
MKNKFLLLTWLLAVPLLWPGCDKPNDCPELKLPPLTTEGLNTFGCVIDGEVWVPHVDWQLIQTPLDFGEITVVHHEEVNHFYIRVDRRPNGECDETDQVIHIGLNIKEINESDDSLIGSASFNDWNTGNWQYRLDTTVSRVVDIHKFDLDERILSGTFSFDFKDYGTDEVREVRDGRFDLKF